MELWMISVSESWKGVFSFCNQLKQIPLSLAANCSLFVLLELLTSSKLVRPDLEESSTTVVFSAYERFVLPELNLKPQIK
jgi:hypothetical protein